MRPNIDISWDLHGRIKEYGNETGQDLGGAYQDLLQRGLSTQSNRSGRFQKSSGGDVVFSRIDENLGVGTVALFSPFSAGYYDDPTVLRATERNLSVDDAEGILHDLVRRFGGADGNYSVHQRNAAWYSNGGLDEFVYWLDNLDELYRTTPDEFTVDRHRSASAAWIGGVAYPAADILVYATPNGHGTLEKFGVEFLIDGYPLEGGEFQAFADTVDIQLSHTQTWETDVARPDNYHRVPVTEEGPVVLEEPLYSEGSGNTEDRDVNGVVCRNPFWENAEEAQRELDHNWLADQLPKIERLPGPLNPHIDEITDHELYTARFMLSDLLVVSEAPFHPFNVNFAVKWSGTSHPQQS